MPQLIEVGGRSVIIFSCAAEGLSPRRQAEPAGGGVYTLIVEGIPTSSTGATALDLPGLYACRVVRDFAGQLQVIGFVHRGDKGAFAGTLSEPVPLRSVAPALITGETTHRVDKPPMTC